MTRTLLTLFMVGVIAGCSPVESTPDKTGRGQTLSVKKPDVEYVCYLSEYSSITHEDFPISEYQLESSRTTLVSTDKKTKRVLTSSTPCEFRTKN